MKTSWIETKDIDDYLSGRLDAEQTLLFKAELLINPQREVTLLLQQKAHALVKLYSRKKLKAELESVHQKLFREPEHEGFKKKILAIFKAC